MKSLIRDIGMVALLLLGTCLLAQESDLTAATRPAGVGAETEPRAVSVHNARGSKFNIEVRRLSPRVAIFHGDPWTNAIVAIAAQKGIVVVDAPFSKTISQGFREAIRQEFKRTDFACLINTHEDLCHIGGNVAYADLPIVGHGSIRSQMLETMANPKWVANWSRLGEREVAHTRARLLKADSNQLEEPGFTVYEQGWKLIQADYHAEPVLMPPTVTFDREMALYLDDITMRLMYFGCDHSTGDTIISVPEENIVLTGGIFYPTRIPVISRAAGRATPQIVNNWFTVMHAILKEANGNTRFIPSHDRDIMNKEQCARQVKCLERLWAGLRRARADGKSLEQARADLPLASFPEVADLPNETGLGTLWELHDIHARNIDQLWKVLGKSPALSSDGKRTANE